MKQSWRFSSSIRTEMYVLGSHKLTEDHSLTTEAIVDCFLMVQPATELGCLFTDGLFAAARCRFARTITHPTNQDVVDNKQQLTCRSGDAVAVDRKRKT